MSTKTVREKRVMVFWVFITVAALLLLVAGVLSVEMRETKVERMENEFSAQPSEALADHVYLIIVDGLRVDGMDSMPYLSELASQGGYGIMTVPEPTFSRPAYARIITGASSSITGINSNMQARKLDIPTIYDLAVSQGLTTGASAYKWFYEIAVGTPYRTGKGCENRTIKDRTLPIQYGYYYDDNDDYTYDDREIFAQGKGIMEEHTPNFLIVHSMEVDMAGHNHGGTSVEYRERVKENDLYIRELVEAIPHPEKSIVMVMGDHGHIDRGGHGGPEKEAIETPLVIWGHNVLTGSADGYTQLDLAPTIAALLGMPFSTYMEGKVMDEPFDWPAGTAAAYNNTLSRLHQPFVASLYDRFEVPYADETEEISVTALHEIMHLKAVFFKFIFALAILLILFIILFLWFKLYRWNNIRNIFRGKGWTLASAFIATIVYILVYQLALKLLGLDYSYSIVDVNVKFVGIATLPPLIAFVFFYLIFARWMKERADIESFSIHTITLVIAFLATIIVAAVKQGGNDIFLPDFKWFLVYAFSAYHLFITGLCCIVFSRFTKKSAFDLDAKARQAL
ncbi:MAG: sulfatase-like hydrolase/transferase [Firmicutes bacterium]|jgi:hypothetical protein|nr:sulfatase-like hydrolase/transferase [Bacillota bacterium]